MCSNDYLLSLLVLEGACHYVSCSNSDGFLSSNLETVCLIHIISNTSTNLGAFLPFLLHLLNT